MSASLRAVVALLLASSFFACEAFEEACPATPTPCRNDARVTVELGEGGALTDPLVAYRLTIETPAGKDAAGTEQPARKQLCLFATPQNLVRCDAGPFVASLTAPARGKCTTTPPDVGVNGDGAIVVAPPESSCTVTADPLKLELSSTTLPEGPITLTLERGNERFLPLIVEAGVLETRPDGPKCGNTCRERIAPLSLAMLTNAAPSTTPEATEDEPASR